jgi:glycosyltransferase involved in cell wall biosynthesis
MRVVYASSIDRFGPLAHLRDLAPAVAREGADVKVLCLDETVAASFRSLGVEAAVTPLASKHDLRGAAAVWQHLAGADVVHTQDPRTGLFVRPQAFARRLSVVHTLHGLPYQLATSLRPPGAPAAASNGASRHAAGHLPAEALLSRLGTVVVPSRALGDYISRHGVPARRVRVIPHGIEVLRSEPTPAGDPPVLATSALLDHHKGIDVLLEACALLEAPYRLDVYGDGPLRGTLEVAAARLGVAARFHGFVEDMRDRLLAADVFVLPTRGDNFPVSILEAMASALPVVSTRVGGVPEQIVDGVTGILVDPDDAPALARALTELLEDPRRRASLGTAGARRARQEFDRAVMARRTLSLYEELCSARGRR